MAEKSQDYSWEYVIADKKLSDGPCELVYACLVPSASTTTSALYNGKSVSGAKIVDLKVATVDNFQFEPPVPIYCDGGLFVDVGTSVTGILVQWRELKK